jgi:hypothetical protein
MDFFYIGFCDKNIFGCKNIDDIYPEPYDNILILKNIMLMNNNLLYIIEILNTYQIS